MVCFFCKQTGCVRNPERKETNSGDTPIFRFYDFGRKYLFSTNEKFRLNPIGSMYGIFTYIWLISFSKCR